MLMSKPWRNMREFHLQQNINTQSTSIQISFICSRLCRIKYISGYLYLCRSVSQSGVESIVALIWRDPQSGSTCLSFMSDLSSSHLLINEFCRHDQFYITSITGGVQLVRTHRVVRQKKSCEHCDRSLNL